MVVLDDSMADDEQDVEDFGHVVEISGKTEKAHNRGVCGLWSFRQETGPIGLISVKKKNSDKSVTISEREVLANWRPAVQSCDVTNDGKTVLAVGLDSRIHQIAVGGLGTSHETRDFGYMETVYATMAPDRRTFAAASFSGHLSEGMIGENEYGRREKFPNIRNVSCLQYSTDMQYLAVGQTDGAIDLYEMNTFKPARKYEVHSMRIRKIVFLPGGEQFLSASDDKLIKLHSLGDVADFSKVLKAFSDSTRTNHAIRVFAGHKSSVLSVAVDLRSSGTRFATGSACGEIFMWHLEIASPICKVPSVHEGNVTALTFSPSGRHLLASGEDKIISCYNVPASGEPSPIPETYPEDAEESHADDKENYPYYEQQEGEPMDHSSQNYEPTVYASNSSYYEAYGAPGGQYAPEQTNYDYGESSAHEGVEGETQLYEPGNETSEAFEQTTVGGEAFIEPHQHPNIKYEEGPEY
ncbi:unnamed protein product [Caenorhabditis auriculariae]|uniref:Anaphase-promoting complex subunit 4 WD40 domain-containing protein n=1 Tax=Caenorhabditis auriculariae TaxID=2777116 RepID=A0A8S1GS01_9PELO|nr:unnamed protein product [Caenorhabditis auriculariae]